MAVQLDVRHLRRLFRVDHGQSPAAVADVEQLRLRVVPHVICVIQTANSGDDFQRLIVKPKVPVTAAGDGQFLGLCDVKDTLRLFDAANATTTNAVLDICDLHRIVSECGDEEASALCVDCHVVDPAFYAVEPDCLDQTQCLIGPLRCGAEEEAEHKTRKYARH